MCTRTDVASATVPEADYEADEDAERFVFGADPTRERWWGRPLAKTRWWLEPTLFAVSAARQVRAR